MLQSPELQASLHALIGEGPARSILIQTDSERTAIVAEAGGAPIVRLANYSSGTSTPLIETLSHRV